MLFFVVKLNCIRLDFVLVLLPEWMELRINLVGMDISPIKLNSTFECTCIKLLFLFLAFFALFRIKVLIKKKLLQKNRPLTLSMVIMFGNSDHFI